MRSLLPAILLAATATATTAFAQGAIPNGPVQGAPPTQGQPRGNGVGLGGIGISLSFGKKKPAAPQLSPIEMRDADIADHVEGRVIFTLPLPAPNVAHVARAAGVTVVEAIPLDQMAVMMVVASVTAPDTIEAAIGRLQRQRGVEHVQPDYRFQSLGSTSRSKGFKLHGIPDSDRTNVAGTIVLIDTVVDTVHPNLSGLGIRQSAFGVAATPSAHGTAIAELLVGKGDFAGSAAGAQLVSLAAFAPAGETSWLSQTSSLARAMNEALRLRPNVLNLSFGRNGNDPLLARALDLMQQRGVCVVAAAGNGSGKPVLFPATHPASLAVTAVDGRMRAYRYASQGPQISVAAWGVDLSAAVPGGRRSVSGTSFATAIVSGALLRTPECSSARNPTAMKARMIAQARDLGPKGSDPVFGAGLFELSAPGALEQNRKR